MNEIKVSLHFFMHHDHLMGPGLMLQVYAVTNDFVADYFWLSSSSMTEPTIKVSENGHTKITILSCKNPIN
jgi:hypothetical protein